MAIFILFFVLHPYLHDARMKKGEKSIKLKQQRKTAILCVQIELCIKYGKREREREKQAWRVLCPLQTTNISHTHRPDFLWSERMSIRKTGSVSHMDEREKWKKNGCESERLSQRDNE